MRIPGLDTDFQRLAAPLPIHFARVAPATWSALAGAVAANQGQIVSLWASDHGADGKTVSAAYQTPEGLVVAELALTASASYPDVASHFPAASRMQRAAHDLVGVGATGAADQRPWLRHTAWPADYLPLAAGNNGAESFAPGSDDYLFVRVEGDGVHEIPVGPVHAGIIEPGHFRFSVVGEKVLRLEERLGYTHKGVERHFAGLDLAAGARLAGRVSGDSTVAYAWAYAMAAESLAGVQIPDRASWLRAVLLERERIANHLGDLGALGNDAAFSFALTQFSLLREDWQRTSHAVFGHRLLMDQIIPGGVARDLDEQAIAAQLEQIRSVRAMIAKLRRIFDEHAGMQERFVTTGHVDQELALRLGLTGFALRASGIGRDLRSDFPFAPYVQVDFKCMTRTNGDVGARVNQRFDEISESLRLLLRLLRALPPGQIAAPLATHGRGRGFGWVEGWRGPVMVALETGSDGTISRCHCHDPSWQNWPVLEHAIIGNIVADFPLINKSFNLSYSGQDL
ncbi:MAG: NADH-quinone oxidoreductase subunit C [Burkholderiaceae bacterium]|nr:NADH-quinone oxidoreductase subunit C [Burkholderiaceae bacterium]